MITVKINGRVHDKAQVASISFDLGSNEIINGGIALLRDRLSQQLNITNRWADEQGALIGHVKAYIKWGEDEAIMLSTTGAGTEVKGSEIPSETPDKAEIGITAIVFGTELKAVKDRLIGIAGAIAGQYGDYCIFTSEHKHEHKHINEITDKHTKVKAIRKRKL